MTMTHRLPATACLRTSARSTRPAGPRRAARGAGPPTHRRPSPGRGRRRRASGCPTDDPHLGPARVRAKGIEWAHRGDGGARVTSQPRPRVPRRRADPSQGPPRQTRGRRTDARARASARRRASASVTGCEFDDALPARPIDLQQARAVDADVVLLPYDSREQVTSGVLVEAVAARAARRLDRRSRTPRELLGQRRRPPRATAGPRGDRHRRSPAGHRAGTRPRR